MNDFEYEIKKQLKKQKLVKNEFMLGDNEALKRINPEAIVCYDDPLAKNIPVTCSVCGKTAYIAESRNGKCPHCGWWFSADEAEFDKNYGITYPMLVSLKTAREQYRNGLPFKATFDEFVRGLYFYAEMQFKYDNVWYNVFLEKDCILFGSKYFKAKFSDAQDFMQNAQINGVPLKDLWKDVTYSGYMDCSIEDD